MRPTLLLALSALLTIAPASQAQIGVRRVTTGDTIRVALRDGSFAAGILTKVEPTGLAVMTSAGAKGTSSLPFDHIKRVDVLDGRRSVAQTALRGAKYGAIGGTGAGLLWALALVSTGDTGEYTAPLLIGLPFVGAAFGAVAGLQVGGLAAPFLRRHHWVAAELPQRGR
jgi:hypothetical protein